MEEGESYALVCQGLGERSLSDVKGPGRSEIADILVGVGVADHDLLGVVLRTERLPVDRLCQDGLHRRGRFTEGVPGLE
jgi:hypothetical protein